MIKRVLKNRLDRIGKYLPQTHFFDKAFCQYDYFLNNGYIVKNPKTFKEFIFKQRYEDNSFLRKLTTDKECAKWYIKEKIGHEAFPKTYSVFQKKIDHFDLDTPYVAKPTHSCGSVILKPMGGQLSQEEIRLANSWFKEDYYIKWRSLNYKNLDKKIIIEEYLGSSDEVSPDYKVLCFWGMPIVIQLNAFRFSKHFRWIYTTKWEPLQQAYEGDLPYQELPPPQLLDKMNEWARILSKDFNFLRVDFDEHNNKLYVGELTSNHLGTSIKWKDRDLEIFLGQCYKEPLAESVINEKLQKFLKNDAL